MRARLEAAERTVETQRNQFLEDANDLRAKLEAAKSTVETLKASANTEEDPTPWIHEKAIYDSKIRKFIAHSQRLEDERSKTIAALLSCGRFDVSSSDAVPTAVITLCDRLASLENEITSLLDERDRESSMSAEMTSLRNERESLQERVASIQSAMEKLQRSYSELSKMANRNEALLMEANEAKCRLEQENLQLMRDLKAWKNQYKSAKAELESQRLLALEEPTEILSRLPSVSSHESKLNEAAPKAHDKENLPETATAKPAQTASAKKGFQGVVGRLTNSSRKRAVPADFGETGSDPSEENTQECKQS